MDADTISTERLLLRRFSPFDWKDLYEYLSMPEVLTWLPEWRCTEEACKRIAIKRSRGNSFWAVCLGKRGKMIGHVELIESVPSGMRTFETGYVLHPSYRGRGYATEAVARIIGHGVFQLNANRITATCDTENESSWRLMERLGMRREAHYRASKRLRRDEAGHPSGWRDEFRYAILADELRNRS